MNALGIGSLFQGLAQGAQVGMQFANDRARIGIANEQLGLERQKQEIELQTLQNSLLDARTQAQALAPMAQGEQSDAKLFSWMADVRNAINADPGTRKAQMPVFAQQFKAATGQDLAPNVLESFVRGDAATLTRALDDATHQILANGTPSKDVAGLLTDPVRSAQWFANASAKASAAADQPDIQSPGASQMAIQVGTLNRSAMYADQRVQALTEALPNMRTQAGVDKINAQIQFWQQRGDTLRSKVAELSKPMNVTQGGALVEPTTGATIASRPPKPDVLSPEAEAQKIRIAKAAIDNRAAAAPAGAATLDPGAIDIAANKYLMTGEMPSVGYGAAGFVQRAKIMNRAAEMAAANGDSAQEAAINANLNKNTLAADRHLQAQKQKIQSFETTAMKNADLVEGLIDKVDNTKVPVFNRWLLGGKRQLTSDADVAKYDIALRGFINEYARIVSTATGGGVLTDTARQEVETVINAAQTPAQLRAAIATAKAEMKNRIAGFEDTRQQTISDLRASTGGGAAATDGDGGANNAPAIARPKDKAAYDALSNGQPYIAPDGSRRIKGQ